MPIDATQRNAILSNLRGYGLRPEVKVTIRETGPSGYRGSDGTGFDVMIGDQKLASGAVGTTRRDNTGRLYADLNAWEHPTSKPRPGESGREQTLRQQAFFGLARNPWD